MKRTFVMVVALLAALAIALPAFAVEVKYGGLFRARIQSNNNFTDGNSDLQDNQNYFDQRLRIFFQFIASENLRLVTGFEQDTLWGDSRGKTLTGHRDTVGLELKHAYVDFMIPQTPLRTKVGLQPLAYMTGWIVDEDFTGIVGEAKFGAFKVSAGYVGEVNNNVTTTKDNVDDWFAAVDWAEGPFTAQLVGFYQYGHDQLDAVAGGFSPAVFTQGNNDNLFDLGLNLGYKGDWFDVFGNYIQNFGSYDNAAGDSVDYGGYMFEAGANAYWQNFTFTLGGFMTSGDGAGTRAALDGGTDENFRYPVGRSHYWSEIMGLGTLDTTVNGSTAAGANDPPPRNRGGYEALDGPSNLWTVQAGIAYQALAETKLTFNYYYLGTVRDVLSDAVTGDSSGSIGHEFDVYVDQGIVDGLKLRLVGAYLLADDALTASSTDDDIYELGARLQWSF